MKPDIGVHASLNRLFAYCQSQAWRGYDPYDGLNSRLFGSLPFKDRWFRLVFAQLVKRSPLNLRELLGISKGLNPKGLSLFLNGCLTLYRLTGREKYFLLSRYFLQLLKELSCKGYSGHCWGYNFDWQSRYFFLPQGTPTAVNTVFVANALLNLYETLGEEESLQMALSSCEFLLHDLNRWEGEGEICFSYTPLDSLQIYNANIWAAQLLCRVHRLGGERSLLEIAQKATRYVIRNQNHDGSWCYGKQSSQNWVDGHHTGFILVALNDIITLTGNTRLASHLKAGLDFYRRQLFRPEGIPKYYPNSLFPIDIHCAAQGIITFVQLRALAKGHLAFAQKVAHWTIQNMQDRAGYFYYRMGRFLTNKIPYIRWGQAWMFYALSELISALQDEGEAF